MLLDQFQEYVNQQEQKQQQDEEEKSRTQEQALAELHETIKELEALSQQLQGEVAEKEEVNGKLKEEVERVAAVCEDLRRQVQETEQKEAETKGKKIEGLEEEINYLKKHYDIEISLLKDENEILQRELNEAMNRRGQE